MQEVRTKAEFVQKMESFIKITSRLLYYIVVTALQQQYWYSEKGECESARQVEICEPDKVDDCEP